ncbi:MAG: hypothetical protein KKE23_03360 [Nanoarchaeota archaeon]|nr:hypothetical protein [Nanoarchaeota archaeon]
MEFEIDVSGEDIFNEGYTIVIADKSNIVRGFKFHREMIQILRSRHGEGKYRYPPSKQGKALLRVRLYCIAVYRLFKALKEEGQLKNQEAMLSICKDFQGHEKDINSNLIPLLGKLGLKIKTKYHKLPKDSPADKYAYLMRKDDKNKMNGYISLNVNDFEKYLKK